MQSFSFSTPVRRNGDKLLPTIPNEIYLEILDNFQPVDFLTEYHYKANLARLSRVCRLFRFVASQRIFKSIRLSGRPSEADSAPYLWNIPQQITMNEEPGSSYALFVKECLMRGFQETKQEDTAALSLHTAAAAHMTNIQSLTIHDAPLADEQLSALSNLVNLEFLSLVDCRISEGLPADAISLNKLASLKMIYCKRRRFLIESVKFPALKVFRTDSFAFAYEFVSQSYNPPIEELHLEFNHEEFIRFFGEVVTVPVQLRRILQRCPSINHLSFYHLPIPKSSPISTIFGAATHPLPPLRTLEFNLSYISLEKIMELLFEIREDSRFSKSLTDVVFAIGGFDAPWVLDLPEQHERVIAVVSRSLPLISRIQLDMIEWRRQNQDVWHPRVVSSALPAVRSRLRQWYLQPRPKDFGDCLASIMDPDLLIRYK